MKLIIFSAKRMLSNGRIMIKKTIKVFILNKTIGYFVFTIGFILFLCLYSSYNYFIIYFSCGSRWNPLLKYSSA